MEVFFELAAYVANYSIYQADEMTARLEAGLLTMKIPKEHLHLAKNKGEIKIASGD